MVASYDDTARFWRVPGQIGAEESTPLSFRLDGKIIRRAVRTGDQVRAGQVLAELDAQPLKQNLDSAQAQWEAARQGLAFASKQLKRDEQQARADLIAKVQLEQSRNAYAQALAQFTQAKNTRALATDHLGYTRLTAPRDGVITAEQAQTGQNIGAGQAVYTLAWGDVYDVVCDVSERQIANVSVGQQATVQLTAIPDQALPATVREIAPAADPMSRSFRIKLSLKSSPSQARLGMTATVRFEASPQTQTSTQITLPATALFHEGGAPAVWIVGQDGKITLRKVKIASYGAQTVTLSEGLRAGERVVAQGVHTVTAGQIVRVPADYAGGAKAAGEQP